jgi:nucleoside-diphosphate-sugar epimerase
VGRGDRRQPAARPGPQRGGGAARPAAHYLFVSSVNVYADSRSPARDESSPLLPPLAGEVMESMAEYGEAKVACEQHVLRGFGRGRALVARAG